MSLSKKLALFVLIILTPWIFFDVDLGDQAYMSLVGRLMAHQPHPPAGTYPYWFEAVPVWGSFMQDFFIYKLFGSQIPMLFLRFFWVLWHVAIALTLFWVFGHWWKKEKVFRAIAVTTLACVVGSDHFTLSYYSVPAMYGVLSVAFLALGQKNKFWIMISGVFAVFAITARFSVFPFFIFYFGALFVLRKQLKINFLGFFHGLFMGAVAAFAFLWATQQLQYVLPGLYSFFEGVAHKKNIRFQGAGFLPKMFGHYLKFLVGAVFFVFLKWFYLKVIQKKSTQTPEKIFFILLGFGVFALCLYRYGSVLSFVIGGGLATIGAALYHRKFKITAEEMILISGSVVVLICFAFGTFLEGVQNYKYSLWLLLPLAFLIESPREQSLFLFARKTLALSIVVLFAVTRLSWPTFPYFEKPIFEMTQKFKTPVLKGIFTYPEKQKSLDNLFSTLKEMGVRQGDTLFCYGGVSPYYPISLIYQVTGTVPYLLDPGLMEYPGSRWDRYKMMISRDSKRGDVFKFVVRQKRHYSGADFSSSQPFVWSTENDNWLGGVVDDYLKEAGFAPVWEDGFFVILKSPRV